MNRNILCCACAAAVAWAGGSAVAQLPMLSQSKAAGLSPQAINALRQHGFTIQQAEGPEVGLPVVFVDISAASGGNGMSWQTAINDLTVGLNVAAALPGEEVQIWVAQGVYHPGSGSDARASTFALFDGVEVYGGFVGNETQLSQRDAAVNQTILSGDLGEIDEEFDNAYHVVTFDELLGQARLDGLIIEHGKADGNGDDQNIGGGLRVRLSTAIIVDCLFRWNNAAEAGGAIECSLATPIIDDCTFSINDANDGGALKISDGAVITASSFSNNKADFGGAISSCCAPLTLNRASFKDNDAFNIGGGVFIASGPLTAKRCSFYDNEAAGEGGGVYVAGAGLKALVNCRFGGNTAQNGGAIYNTSQLQVTNNLIIGNFAFDYGGGIYNNLISSTIDIANSTIVDNAAGFWGGGAYIAQGLATVSNAIAWNNDDQSGSGPASQIKVSSLAVALIQHCDIMNWQPDAAGNFSKNPSFVDPAGIDGVPSNEDDNYTLKSNSPCIDMGSADYLPLDPADLDEDGSLVELVPLDLALLERIVDAGGKDSPTPQQPVDIGAYEYRVVCEGDIDGDGMIDSSDLNIFFGDFGKVGDLPSDIDGDGFVTTLDLNILLFVFGNSCDVI